jgi:VWFA-related protein
LQQEDFAVVDGEDVIHDFRSFTQATPFKLDVVVLIDASGSVLSHLQQEVTTVLQSLSQWPSGPGDNLSVFSFSGTEVHPLCAGDCESELPRQVASLQTGGTTPLFDALSAAAILLLQRRQPDVWPVVVLFSDGGDTISRASFQEARDRILSSEAQIYAVDISNAPPDNGTATLQALADGSGGRYLKIRSADINNFSDIMNDIAADLRSARVVTYPLPSSKSGFRSLRILPAHNLTWQFHCRRGYYNLIGSN